MSTLRERVAETLHNLECPLDGTNTDFAVDAILSLIAEDRRALDAKAYAVLAVYGVPQERARSVSNGIAVLAERFRHEVTAKEQDRRALVGALKEAKDCLTYRTDTDEQHRVIGLIDAALAAGGEK